MDPKQAFSLIYERGMWGKAENGQFFSGKGSHDHTIVQTYVKAVSDFIVGLGYTPDVVDLGCGDFNVGMRLRNLCARYVACDVVPALIARNQLEFGTGDVEFRVVDITHDDIPVGDVLFLRQVLQHLSNIQIDAFLRRLPKCQYLVVTEHLPEDEKFIANIDKSVGHGTRMDHHVGAPSGVVLTAPPFGLKAYSERVLCECHQFDGIIRTTAYQLDPPKLSAPSVASIIPPQDRCA